MWLVATLLDSADIYVIVESSIWQYWSRILLIFYQIISANVLLLAINLGSGVSFLLTPSCCFSNTFTPLSSTTLAPLTTLPCCYHSPAPNHSPCYLKPLVLGSIPFYYNFGLIQFLWGRGENLINLGSLITLSLLIFFLNHSSLPLYIPGTCSPGTLHNSEILNPWTPTHSACSLIDSCYTYLHFHIPIVFTSSIIK